MTRMCLMRSVSNSKPRVLQNIAVKSLGVKMKELVRRIVAFFFSQADVVDPVVAASMLLAKATDSRGEGQVSCASSRHPPVFTHD
mgnify:CR=1 FL=1